jgi:hypothetical protein
MLLYKQFVQKKKYLNKLTQKIPACLIREHHLFLLYNYPVTAQCKALEHWDCGFEFFATVGCIWGVFRVTLLCVTVDLEMALSKNLTKILRIF